MNFEQLAQLIEITCYVLVFACVWHTIGRINFYRIYKMLKWRLSTKQRLNNKIDAVDETLDEFMEQTEEQFSKMDNRMDKIAEYSRERESVIMQYVNARLKEENEKPKLRRKK